MCLAKQRFYKEKHKKLPRMPPREFYFVLFIDQYKIQDCYKWNSNSIHLRIQQPITFTKIALKRDFIKKVTISPPPVTESVAPVTSLVYHKQLLKYIRIVDSKVGYIRIKLYLRKKIYIRRYDHYMIEGNKDVPRKKFILLVQSFFVFTFII